MAEGDKTYKVRYKNHCTPQEQLVSGGRYYLDSDCGRKLTGDCSIDASITTAGTYDDSFDVTTTASSALTSSHDFIFIKNTGSGDVFISLTVDALSDYSIVLSTNEAFASEINSSAAVRVKCKVASGSTSTIEYYAGK